MNDSRRPERLRRRRRQLLLESLETRQLLATLTVSTGFDITDANDGLISLREAIATAESNGEADTIVFAPSLAGTEIQLIEIGDSTATEGRSLLKISSDINIVGPATIVRGQSASNARLFLVDGAGRLTLDTVTLSNGLAQGGNGGDSAAGGGGGGAGLGGAIWNRGTVTIQSSTLSGNTAQGGNGGRSGVNGLARGGASGGSLLTNGANPINDNGVAGVNGGGSGGGLAQGALIQVGGDGGGAGFGSGGGGGGFGVSSGGNGSFHGGGIGGGGGFGGGGGGEGRGTGGQNYASRPNSAAGFGGGFGSNNGGGGGAGLGGAIFNDGGTLTITNSTLSSNAAVGGNGGEGSGGIFSGQGGYGHGGAVFNRDGSVTITSSTLANNNVNNGGGSNSSASGTAIYNLQSSGTATINVTNSILASTDFRNDAFNNAGTVSGSNNLIEQNGNFPSEVIVSSAAPMLGPLQFNGGPTRTHALLTGSPAIDAGIAPAPASINLARQAGAVASQSSTNVPFAADRAINGIANDFSHTASTDTSPSWQVTFPSDSVIENVTLRNRTDGCCQGRLRDITVEILDSNGAVVFTSDVLNPRATAGNDVNVGPAQLVVNNIPANTTGRTVRVRREPQDGFGGGDFDARVLTLSEVVVQGVVPVVNDQRGIPFARVSGTAIDLGAVEFFTQPPLVVSTLTDELDNDLSDGDLSLREAIALANATSAADTITFAPSLDGTIELTLGQLLVTAPLTISSSSDNRITIDALDNSRVIDITETAGDVSLVALVIQNGETNAENQGGAGIRSRSTGLLTLNDTTVRSNDALGATSSGGGISTTGEVVIRNSTVSGNSAQGTTSRGGGVYSYDGKITLIDSTVSANYTISGYGGGVGTIRSTITAINSTISGNLSVGGSNGAGIGSFSGPIILTNSTVTLNSSQGANGTGGGVGSNQGPITVNNSIIAGNTAANGPDLNQGIGSPTLQSSLLGDNSGTSLVAAPVGTPDSNGNLIGTGAAKIDPLLGPLERNGGRVATHALLTDSPAINAGSNALAVNGATPLANDQRGVPFVRQNGIVDMGAYEAQTFGASFFVVTTATDEFDYTNTQVSLREAVNTANENPGADTITFDNTVFATAQTISLTLGQMRIVESLTISGPGQTLLTVDAQQASRFFEISTEAGDVTLSGMTLTGGRGGEIQRGGAIRSLSNGLLTIANSTLTGNSVSVTTGANAYGGAIFVRNGNLAITNSTLSENSAFYGGAIYARGDSDVTITGSTISGNTSTFNGGAIFAGYDGQGDVAITNSTFSANTAGRDAGAILADNVTITNSTISGNSAVYSGGGIFAFEDLTITNSTIAGNGANIGGGIHNYANNTGESLTIRNSIIAGNTAPTNPDFTAPGEPTTNLVVAFSIIGDNSGTTLAGASTAGADGNLIGIPGALIDPMLGPLADNGGSTQTHALLTDSPAINAGNNDLAVDASAAPLATDQRGTGFNRIVDATVDIGAFERGPLAGFTVVQSGGSTQVSETGTTDTFTVVLTNAPTSNVVLTVVSADTGEATVSAATLTFTPANFATPQTITVTGVNDTIRDGSQSTNITLAVDDANSADAFDSLDDQVVAVTTTDNETSSLLVVQSGGNTSVFDSGTTDTLTVALSSAPLTNVVVNVSLSSTTHASLNTAALTFTPANFATPQTVTVTGKNDNVANGDQTATIAIAVNNATSDDLWDGVTAPNVNVAIVEGRFDFGDAPASFPTLLPGGARHQAVGPTLGTRRDIEDDGQPNATATGDDAPADIADAVKVASGSGGRVNSTAVGDLNADGNLDLVMAVSGNAAANPVIPDTLAVLLGNGDGTFAAPTQVALGAGTGAIFVVLDDFDGDQLLDAAVLNNDTNDVSLLNGNGDGTFENARVISLGSTPPTVATFVSQIASANVGGSAAPDLLIVDALSNDVTVLINNTDGTFAAPQSFAFAAPLPITPPPQRLGGLSLIVEDLNGDGNRDIAVANFDGNNINVMLNSGTGTFPNVRANLIDPAGTNGAAGPGTVVAGDFNGDGNVDLLTANGNSGDLTLLTGNGTDTFAAQAPIALPGSGPGISFLTTILASDLNGDGNLDVVITDQGTGNGGAVYVMLGNGNGTFQTATRLTGGLTAADSAFRLSIADLNKDGTAELIADVGTGVAIFSTTQGDEDGVTFPAAPIGTTAQGSVTVNLQNAAPTTNLLDAWIDFNRDGDWDDAGEKIFNAFSLGTTNGPQTLNFPLPEGIVAGNSFARFRISTTGISTPGGLAIDGEVEDHRVALVTPVITPTLDFGDAPATYPVTLAQDGARHTVGALFFGAKVDAEANGISSASADSDGDDEDGVFVLTTFITSTVATTSSFSVFASQAGKLDGWIDFNNDGDWSDAGEQIFTSADVVAGENLLSFTIPAGAANGSTGARFRLSTAGGLAPTGLAADGEVEDYLANVVTGSANALLNIAIPVGDVNGAKSANISVEGTDLVVKKNDVVLFKAPFASFGNLSLNGSSIDDILQLTILEALATRTFEFDGGLGKDFLELVASGQTLDLTNARITLRDVEGVDVAGTGANRLVISIDAVKNASSTTDTLEVVADADDSITFVNGFKVETPTFINGEFTHIITESANGGTARVELRNDRPLTNPLTSFDADRNGRIQPLDALRIINELSRRGAGRIAFPTNESQIGRLYFDVSGDMQFTALDALRVINAIARINSGSTILGEGEAAPGVTTSNSLSHDTSVVTPSATLPEPLATPKQASAVAVPAPATKSDAVDDFFIGYDDEELRDIDWEPLLSARDSTLR